MNHHRTSFLLSALAASLAFTLSPASAQTSSASAQADANRPTANAAYKSDQKAVKNADEAWQRTHRASKIIGTEVRNPQGQKVGKVKDLVLEDPASGRISQVVIAVGGVLGMGDKLFAVPFEQVQVVAGQKYVVLSGSSDLSQTFDEKHWPEAATRTAGATTSSTSTDRTSGVAMSPNASSSATSTSPSTPPATTTNSAPSTTPSASSSATSAGAPPSSATSSTTTDTTSGSNASTSTTGPSPAAGTSSPTTPSSSSSTSSTPSSSSSSSSTSGTTQ